jgi:hypothetical protein
MFAKMNIFISTLILSQHMYLYGATRILSSGHPMHLTSNLGLYNLTYSAMKLWRGAMIGPTNQSAAIRRRSRRRKTISRNGGSGVRRRMPLIPEPATSANSSISWIPVVEKTLFHYAYFSEENSN